MVVIGEERMGRGRKDGVYAHGFEVGCVGFWGDGPGREARELASLHVWIRGGYQHEGGQKS